MNVTSQLTVGLKIAKDIITGPKECGATDVPRV